MNQFANNQGKNIIKPPIDFIGLEKMRRNRRKLSPKIFWLEAEDFDEAQVISENNFGQIGDIKQWKRYLNALALLGFEKYVKERNPNIKIQPDNTGNAIDDVFYISIGEFRLCLIIVDHLINDFVDLPTKLLTSAKTAAHFYVLLEVLEEEEQLNIHGFLRYDELFKYSQTPNFKLQIDDSYQLPLSLFDTELSNLLAYTHFLSLSAIKLPTAATSNNPVVETITQAKTKVNKTLVTKRAFLDGTSSAGSLVNLDKWWNGIFEEGWQTIEYIKSTTSNNLIWGYVRSREQPNNSPISLSRTKLFDFGLLLQNKQLALIINLKKQENEEQVVLVQIFPHQQEYLPSGLKLKIILNLNSPESISQEVTAKQADYGIQLEFSEAPGKQFKVEVSYLDAVVTEEFVL